MEHDFLIIGGGVAGITAGASLSALGSVLLWESEHEFGYHASGRSAALFEENYGAAPVVALNRASRAAHEAGGWLTPRGFMLIAGFNEAAAFEQDMAELKVEEIPVEAARGRVPILSEAVTRAAYADGAQDIDTDALLQSGLRQIRTAGGLAVTDRRVTRLEPIRGGWQASAGAETTTARQVIIAAGPWADQVAGLAGVRPLGLTPLRRSMARIAAPDGHDLTGWPVLMGPGESWYAKPDAGALIVSPAEEALMAPMDAYADDMVLAEGMARYQAVVTPEVTRPLSTWAGLRTFAPDRCLAIGPSEVSGVWWSAGQGGYGFQTAPASAQLLADRIAGRPPALEAAAISALDPRRFH